MSFALAALQGHEIAAYLWPVARPKGVIILVHGQGAGREHTWNAITAAAPVALCEVFMRQKHSVSCKFWPMIHTLMHVSYAHTTSPHEPVGKPQTNLELGPLSLPDPPGSYLVYEYGRSAGVGRPKLYDGSWIHSMNDAGYSVAGELWGCSRLGKIASIASAVGCKAMKTRSAAAGAGGTQVAPTSCAIHPTICLSAVCRHRQPGCGAQRWPFWLH